MSGLLPALGAQGTLLVLLVLGHVLGDFVIQRHALAMRKRELPKLTRHVAEVTASHLIVLLPFLSPRVLLVVAGIGVLHFATDFVKVRTKARLERPMLALVVDQLVHLAILAGAWWVLTRPTWQPVASLPGVGPLEMGTVLLIGQAGVLTIAFALNHKAANLVVKALLPGPYKQDHDAEVRTGRRIGTLERYLVLILTLVGQWGAIALVIAAKSIARFEELKHREFAEYYLIGTLASVLIAVVTGLVVASIL